MKKIIALMLFIIFVSENTFAQAPLITSASYFQIGHDYPYKLKLDAALSNSFVGNAGANQIWDFSALQFNSLFFVQDTTSCLPANTMADFALVGISGFDTSNICLVNKSSLFNRHNDAHFYKMDANQLIKLGNNLNNGVIDQVEYLYANPKSVYQFPFTYQSSFADSFQLQYLDYLAGYHYIHGLDSTICDGYGTLIMDSATYPNCARVKTITHYKDSNAVFGNKYINEATYAWFSPDIEGPILTLQVNLDINKISEGAYYFSAQKQPTILDDVSIKKSIQVYPNPSNSFVILKNESSIGALKIHIYNSMGQEIMMKVFSEKTNRIDLSGQANGTYFYTIQSENTHLKSGKILLE